MPLLELELLELPLALASRSSMSVELSELPAAPGPLSLLGRRREEARPEDHQRRPGRRPVSDRRRRRGPWRTR